jgi:acetyl-CoA synthetase
MRDEDGYFWLLGRADEVLKVAGHRIGTAELEDAAVSHPAVAEAAVASKPDEIKGDAIVLFITLKDNVSPSPDLKKELGKHLRNVIGPIATPDEVYFVESLPKTRSGKIMRRVLKAIASGQSPGDLTTLEDEASVEEAKKAYEAMKKISDTAKDD